MNGQTLETVAARLFRYPERPQHRKHGPAGYENPQSFKPWLRDEFSFRCVYCLCRGRWDANGERAFSVEHRIPRTIRADLICVYGNLLYACCTCNAARQDRELPLDPEHQELNRHLQLQDDGTLAASSVEGVRLIEMCQLNRRSLILFRSRLLGLIRLLTANASSEAQSLLCELLAFPEDLPNLKLKRPPGGNHQPNGIAECHFERQRRGELAKIY